MTTNNFSLPSGRKLAPELENSAVDPDGSKGTGIELIEIALDRILPDPEQPRQLFMTEVIDERQQQLEENGQLEAITVLPGKTIDGKTIHILVDGECRWRAAKQSNKIESLLAQIYRGDPEDNFSIVKTQLLANTDGAASITNFERSISYSKLIELAEGKDHDFASNSEYVAYSIAKDIGDFYRIVKLAKVDEKVKSFCIKEGIDDPKVISSLNQIMKIGEEHFNELEDEYRKNGIGNIPSRKYFADKVRIVKNGKTKEKMSKEKKSDRASKKTLRRLSSKTFKIGTGFIELETASEVFRFRIDENIVKKAIEDKNE